MEIREKLQEIMRRTFDSPSLTIEDSMSSKDIEDWDSLTHIQLIASIEQTFKLKFTMKEILGFKNVGEIIILIENKTINCAE